MPAKKNLPEEEIMEKYISGMSSSHLAKEYGCSSSLIVRRLKNHGVKFRPMGHGRVKYHVDENYFKVIDRPDKAYWLGIFLTDGSTSNRVIRLSFQKADEGHLRKFLNDVKSSHPISYQYKGMHVQACICIGNKRMYDNLIEKGIIPNNKKIYKVQSHLARDYWRGAIDGDGCIKVGWRELSLVGTRQTCVAFKRFCRKYVNTKAKVAKITGKKLWSFGLHGDIAFKIVDILYKDSSVHLSRKYQLYLDWKTSYIGKPQFYRVVKFFKKQLPYKFSVNRCQMKAGFEGDCTYKNGRYFIRVSNLLNDNEAVNVCLHELCHLGTLLKEDDPHGSAFGIAYSKIYKMWEAEFT